MTLDNLQTIRSDVESSTYEQTQFFALVNIIWLKDTVSIENMLTAMKLSETAINALTTLKFYENYMDKHGNISWDRSKDNVDQARVAQTSPIQLPSNTYAIAFEYVLKCS